MDTWRNLCIQINTNVQWDQILPEFFVLLSLVRFKSCCCSSCGFGFPSVTAPPPPLQPVTIGLGPHTIWLSDRLPSNAPLVQGHTPPPQLNAMFQSAIYGLTQSLCINSELIYTSIGYGSINRPILRMYTCVSVTHSLHTKWFRCIHSLKGQDSCIIDFYIASLSRYLEYTLASRHSLIII